jgi:gamma-glutamyltranspeptidase / glutathione hydrolase
LQVNELTDFDLIPNHPNRPEPGKRPRSSLSPTITFEPSGNITAYGSPGGSTIITTALGIGFNRMDFAMSLADAIAAPRISQRNDGVTQVDSGFEKMDVGKGLIALGHVLEPVSEIGAATGISIAPDGRITAAAEPVRRGGGSAMTVKR